MPWLDEYNEISTEAWRALLDSAVLTSYPRGIIMMMSEPENYVPYYCFNCTARKFQGWVCCPFCGIREHYHQDPITGKRVDGVGHVKLHTFANVSKQAVNECQAMQGETPRKPSSEDEHFERSIKTIRGQYDNLRRARMQRDKAEAELKAALETVEAQQKAAILQGDKITQLQRDLDIARSRSPEPIRISQVLGRYVDYNDRLLYPLPIITVAQDVGQGCVITVGLRK